MGAKVLVALRSIGILVAVWGVLLLIGFLADAIPPTIPGKPGETSDESFEDASVAMNDAGVDAAPAPARDAGVPDASEAPADPRPAPAAPRWRTLVCPDADTSRPGATAAVAVGNALGGPEPEVLVACGGALHVVGFVGARPYRVALAEGEAGRAMRPLVLPFVDPARNDLIAGHAGLDPGGNPVPGALRLFRGRATSALGEPESLVDAPIVAAAALGGERPGLVAITWPDAHGVRPSEMWIFSGGASPSRRARARIGHDGSDVLVVDRDGDGSLDIVTVDGANVRVFDAAATPGPVFDVPGGRRVVAMEAEGGRDLLVVGDGLHRIRGDEVVPIDAPHGIRSLLPKDVNEDGRTDLLVATRDHVVLLAGEAGGGFTEQALITLPGTLRPHDMAEHDGGLVVVASSVRGWELVSVPLSRVDVPAEEAPALPDAPLVLRWGG